MLTDKNIAVVCNPLAGAGRSVRMFKKIINHLSERNISHGSFKDTWPSKFDGFSDVWIVGGDGTLNYFINKYPDLKVPLVIFNGGTGNDVHWLLYGKLSFEEQLEHVMNALPKKIDVGKCNDRYFINGAGIGFEGVVAKAVTGKKKLPGKTSFMIAVLKKIFFYRSCNYSIAVNERELNQSLLMISISNGRRAGGGFHIAPVAEANDGWLDMITIARMSPLKRLRFLPVIEKGKHMDLGFVVHEKIRKVEIKSDQLIHLHLDGEYMQAGQLNIEILPGHFLFRY